MELGEACFNVTKWTESIEAFEEALNLTTSPSVRARFWEQAL